ncbi:MAG: PAS domain-containing protein, partial [Candidatus Hermodarchaeota archaeon]
MIEKYHTLLNLIEDVVIELDINSAIREISPQCYDLFGFHPDEMIGKEFYDFVHPDYLEIIKKEFKNKTKLKIETSIKIKILHKIGSFIPVLLKGQLITTSGESKVIGILVKYKNTEKKFKYLSIELESLLDNIPAYVFYKDLQDTILYANQNFADHINLEKADIIGKKTSQLFPKEMRDRYLKHDAEVNRTRKPRHNIIEKIPTLNGFGWALTNLIPRFDENDEYIGIIVCIVDITDLKKAEEKLQKSERKFRTAVKNSPDFIMFINIDGIVYDVNRLDKGFTREMVIGQSIFNKIFYETEDQRESAQKAINYSLDTGTTTHYEISHIAPDGSHSFYEAIVSPFEYDNENRIKSLQLAIREFTEWKIAEQKLKTSEEKYRALFEASPFAITLIDKNGTYVDFNPMRTEFFGGTKDELIGRNFKELSLYPPEHRSKVLEAFETTIKGGNPEPIVVQAYNKDGIPMWLNMHGTLVNLGDKQLIQVISKDIDQQIIAEQKLKESEERYRYLFEQSPNAVLLFDLKGKFLEINPMVEKMFGYTKEDLIGKDFTKLNIIHPDFIQLAIELLKEVINKGGPITTEFLFYKKDRTLMWGLIQGSLVRLENKIYIQSIIEDITERKEAEQELKKSEENYRKAYERENLYIDLFTHD